MHDKNELDIRACRIADEFSPDLSAVVVALRVHLECSGRSDQTLRRDVCDSLDLAPDFQFKFDGGHVPTHRTEGLELLRAQPGLDQSRNLTDPNPRKIPWYQGEHVFAKQIEFPTWNVGRLLSWCGRATADFVRVRAHEPVDAGPLTSMTTVSPSAIRR